MIDNNLDLSEAIDRLNKYWFVGLKERFDEALLLLRNQFKQIGRSLDVRYYLSQHVAANYGWRYL